MDLILHAGDIGNPTILTDLEAIAPTTAVIGNVDSRYDFPRLRITETKEIMGHKIYLLHNLDQLQIDPVEQNIDLIIYGHSHLPKVETKADVTYFNPGSAGPRRFSTPISVGIIELTSDSIHSKHLRLPHF